MKAVSSGNIPLNNNKSKPRAIPKYSKFGKKYRNGPSIILNAKLVR